MNSDTNNQTAHEPLPRPVGTGNPLLAPSLSTGKRSAFPPLGATLPTYGGQLGNLAPTLDAPVRPKKRRNVKKIIKRCFISLLIVMVLAGGYIGIKALYNLSKSVNGNLLGLLQEDKLSGEDQGRVNILLAGNSADDAGHSGGDLTDSIMLISLDTKNNTAFVMSIPRDLYVNIPGQGYSKINAAYVYGKADSFSESGYPSGGMGLLEKTVEQNFDVSINYYALVNYSALRDAVNAVGGIDLTVTSSDQRGLYDPSKDYSTSPPGILVKLPNGANHLNGQQALNLARARGDSYGSYGYSQSDFTRTTNQRLMLAAIKDKATSAGVATNPVKLGNLLDTVGNNVQTDFKTTEVRRLVSVTTKIPSSSITSISLNNVDGMNLLSSYRTSNGQSALIPAAGLDDFSDINTYLKKLLTPAASSNAAGGSESSTGTDDTTSAN